VGASPVCWPDPVMFTLSGLAGHTVAWDFGDPTSGAANFSSQEAPTHLYPAPGIYHFSVTISKDTFSLTLTDSVRVDSAAYIFAGPDQWICLGDTAVLRVNGSYGMYQWSTGFAENASGQSSEISVSRPGTYNALVITKAGCSALATIKVKLFRDSPLLGPDTTLCSPSALTLRADPGFVSYYWNNGSRASSITVNETGTYWVQVDNGQCLSRDSITVSFRSCDFLIPNIITPNADQLNDAFAIQGLDDHQLDLQIFNRWGNRIFTATDYKGSWSGQGSPAGVYYYILNDRSTEKLYKGYVEVISQEQ